MNAHRRFLRRTLQLFLFVGMLLGLALLRRAPVAHAINTTSDCFALSNEGGDLISKLDVAGYGDDNLYEALVAIKNNANPSVENALPTSFLAALAAEPAGSEVFTTKLKDVLASGNTVEVCTNGIVQYRTIYGSTYAQTFPTLVSNISGVGSANFTHYTDSNVPLTSWDITVGVITTTYKIYVIAWMAGQAAAQAPAPAKPAEVPEADTLVLFAGGVGGLVTWLGWQSRKRRAKK